MASLAPVFDYQPFDNSGNIVPGGKLWTYESGTTTPKTVYKNQAGSVSHTNPIILDASGRVPGGVIWWGTGEYTAKLTTAADVELRTWDDLSGVEVSSSAADVALRADLASKVNTAKGVGMLGAGANLDYPKGTAGAVLSETISLALFDGATDYARFSAWVAAINASTAHTVEAVIPPGAYSLDSALIGAGSYFLWTRSNVHVVGRGLPQITVTGTTVNNAIFASSGLSRITYRGVRFVGNNQASAYANGAAIWFTNDSAADIETFKVRECEFENFKGDYWVYSECLGTKAISDIRVWGNKFKSATGNARGPSNVAINSACVAVIGNNLSATGFVRGVGIYDNDMGCEFIKSGVIIYNNVFDWHVRGNNITDAGKTGVSDDSGAYAIQVYSQGPNIGGRGKVVDNNIPSPRSCGIYHANSFPGTIYAGNTISGQTDTVTGTLPKGGIVLNGAREVTVRGNQINDCAADAIYWQPDSGTANSDSALLLSGNQIARCLNGINVATGSQNTKNVTIEGGSISECTAGVFMNFLGAGTVTGVRVKGVDIKSAVTGSYGIRLISGDATYNLADFSVQGGSIDCDAYGINATGFTKGEIALIGTKFFGPFSDSAVNVSGSTKLDISGLGFSNFTTGGFCFKTAGAQGAIRGLNFRNVANGNIVEITGSEDLGRDVPTWTGTQGTYVQNLTPQDTTVGGLTSTLDGWRYSGSNWRAQHMLY